MTEKTSGQLQFSDFSDFGFPEQLFEQPCTPETFKLTGQRLFIEYNEICKRHGRSSGEVESQQWAIADWLAWGEEKLKESAYSEARRITGWARSTIYAAVLMGQRFPPSLRRDFQEQGLKWSHFKELVRIEDKTFRDEMLKVAAEPEWVQDEETPGGRWQCITVRRLREKIDKARKKPKKSGSKAHSKDEKRITLLCDREDYKTYKRVARAFDKSVPQLLADFLADYLKSNGGRIMAEAREREQVKLSAKQKAAQPAGTGK